MTFLLGFPPVLMSSPSTSLARMAWSSSRRYWLVQSMSAALESSASSYLSSNESDLNEGSPGQNSKRSCAVSLAVSKPQSLGGGRAEPAAPLWGGGAPGPFAGHSWQRRGPRLAEGSLVGLPAWCCPPEAAGLWVQAVASLASLFLRYLTAVQ